MILEELLRRISEKVSIGEFQSQIAQFWKQELRERSFLPEIRFSQGPCKKFMDDECPLRIS